MALQEQKITLTVPDGMTPEEFKDKLAISLYKNSDATAYHARLITGYSRRKFEELLEKHNVPIGLPD